jgi:DNA (cytosine-5)-methyltransferase 1
MLNGLSLFSGYGGIDLALREYVRPIMYCDIEAYAQAILVSRMDEQSIPFAPIWDDVTKLDGKQFNGLVDIIYGGFPCQDISVAGKGAGLEGQRSGLFREIIRICTEASPQFIFLENVPAIRTRGSIEVQEALASIGYDTRWCTLSAAEVGANHKRERWFCLGSKTDATNNYSKRGWLQQEHGTKCQDTANTHNNGAKEYVAHTGSEGLEGQWESERISAQKSKSDSITGAVNANIPDSDSTGLQAQGAGFGTARAVKYGALHAEWWQTEPNVGGLLSHGSTAGLDKAKLLYWQKEKVNELQTLWENFGAQEVFWSSGGCGTFCEAEVLRQNLHGALYAHRETFKECYSETYSKAQKGILRIVRNFSLAIHSPHRQGLDEQPPGEFADTMFFLSHFLAPQAGPHSKARPERAMQYMRENLLQIKSMLDPSHSIKEAWESLDCEWKESLLLGRWNKEPPIPRVIEGSRPHRTDEIKALGNGVVPLQVKTAFEILIGIAQ